MSNTGQTAASAGELVIETGSVAQQFTTGATASGYALTQVQAYLDSFVGAGVPRVRIFTTGGDGNPGESLYELTNPSSIVNGALNTFTAPAGAVLLKETRYFAVFEQASGATSYRVGATASNAEDAGKATGWSIADESRFRSSNTWRANTAVQLRIAVRGADAPASAAPTVANALLDRTAVVGSDFSYQFAADSFADQDAHDRLAYTATGLPGWLSFDASSRTFSGRPGAGDAGSATVTVTADDRRGGTVSNAFDIVVLDPVLVGNEDSTANSLPSASRSAQAFTTGSHAGGYALTGIRLLGTFTGAGGTVTLHEGTREGTKVADFTAVNTSPGVADDQLVLTPAAATALDADTTYVVVTANDFGAVDLWTTTASDSEDADPAAGWTIADGGEAYQSGSWGTTASAFRLTVHGTRSGAANTAPTAADSAVTATESTDHSFTAAHFSYMDGDHDTLASVKVTSLPGAGLGQLVLDGSTITSASAESPQVVTKAQLDGGELVYRPVAGQFGNDLASFTFRVNDGTVDSADAYTMTVDVDAASTHSVLVSNTSLASGGGYVVGNASGKTATQGFAAGDHAAGYALHSVGIELTHNTFSSSETLTLSVYSSNEDGTANALVHSLTTPWSSGSEIPTGGVVYFTAPVGATLDAGAGYHLVIQGSGNEATDAGVSFAGGNDQTGGTGWTIEDALRVDGALDSDGDSLRIVVRGSERPDTGAPGVTSIARQSPSSSPTNADSLTWRVTFDEDVKDVDAADFAVGGTTATLAVSEVTATTVYDVTASGGDLAGLNATVTLSFAAGQDIEDLAGNALAATAPTGTNEPDYAVDNAAPAVTSIGRQSPSSSPTNADSLTWRVTFDENVKDVDAADFAVGGTTATLAVSEVTASTVYDVTASGGDLAGLNATVTLSFAAGQDIEDLAGNALAATAPTGTNEPDYAVDNAAPAVTSIGRQSPSSSPTNADSLTWRVTFGEDVTGVDLADFAVSGPTGATLAVSEVTASTVYDVTASGGDLASLDATATLSFAAGRTSPTLPATRWRPRRRRGRTSRTTRWTTPRRPCPRRRSTGPRWC